GGLQLGHAVVRGEVLEQPTGIGAIEALVAEALQERSVASVGRGDDTAVSAADVFVMCRSNATSHGDFEVARSTCLTREWTLATIFSSIPGAHFVVIP